MLNLLDFQTKANDKKGNDSNVGDTIEISKKIDNHSGLKKREADLDLLKSIEGLAEGHSDAKGIGTSIAIGSLDYLLDNERFREYKNKNTITIKQLSQS